MMHFGWRAHRTVRKQTRRWRTYERTWREGKVYANSLYPVEKAYPISEPRTIHENARVIPSIKYLNLGREEVRQRPETNLYSFVHKHSDTEWGRRNNNASERVSGVRNKERNAGFRGVPETYPDVFSALF